MEDQMIKELQNEFKDIKEKLGINAFEKLSHYFYTLQRKIEDLIKARDNWKDKYMKLKKELDELQKAYNMALKINNKLRRQLK